MSTIIESIEQRQLRKDIPRFKAGDTVRVHFQVIEGQRRRVQVFEGIVIKRQGSGARETFTVRKQSFGVGVERTFPVHSPKIEKIEVGAVGDVNRAKLYYLREKIGKKARVRELRQTPAQLAAAEPSRRRTRPRSRRRCRGRGWEAAAAAAEAEPGRGAPSRAARSPSPRPPRARRRRARREGVAPTPCPRSRCSRRLRRRGRAAGGAREEVQLHVRSLDGRTTRRRPLHRRRRVWFARRRPNEFTCAARLVEGGCDWFAVRSTGSGRARR